MLIRKAGPFCRTSSSVGLWWEFEEPKGNKGWGNGGGGRACRAGSAGSGMGVVTVRVHPEHNSDAAHHSVLRSLHRGETPNHASEILTGRKQTEPEQAPVPRHLPDSAPRPTALRRTLTGPWAARLMIEAPLWWQKVQQSRPAIVTGSRLLCSSPLSYDAPAASAFWITQILIRGTAVVPTERSRLEIDLDDDPWEIKSQVLRPIFYFI